MKPRNPSARSELSSVLATLKSQFVSAGVFSFFINLLMLVPTLYMLQVYDRVLMSQNETTLLLITVLMLGLYVLLSLLEWVRARLLVRVGLRIEETLNQRAFNAAFEGALKKAPGDTRQVIGDLGSVRQFLTGNGLFAFFDAPWAPIYLAVIFMLHPTVGWFSIGGAVILVILTLVTELATRSPMAEAGKASAAAGAYASNTLANAEVIEAMGMLPSLRERWRQKQNMHLAFQVIGSDRAGVIAAITRFVRISMQSLILGLGAYLVIKGEMTAGGMIAGSVLMGRALAPVEQLIANWRNFVSTRTAYHRLDKVLATFPARPESMPLPAPTGKLLVEQLVAVPPGGGAPILKGVGFSVDKGQVVGIVGPSASGKSTLARLLVGVWTPQSGKVRLDGADVAQWDKAQLGPHLGYLPQDIELFEGSVADNIARFGMPDENQIVAAAQAAGVHEMILRLPQGYDTQIGVGGAVLSGGQKQRIGLARALYGNPALIVLDEPNSNLDDAGEMALIKAVQAQRQRGATVIVITHRVSILGAVDCLMVLVDGAIKHFGEREEVLRELKEGRPAAAQNGPRPTAAQPMLAGRPANSQATPGTGVG